MGFFIPAATNRVTVFCSEDEAQTEAPEIKVMNTNAMDRQYRFLLEFNAL